MKNFIELLKQKDKKITASFINKELKNFEGILDKLEVEHIQIKDDLTTIDYLLDLIDKHKIEASKPENTSEKNEKSSSWFEELINSFEKFHLMQTGELSSQDIEYLKGEKLVLISEKQRLEKELKNIHALIAKTTILLMNVRETVCKELSKGSSIADIGEKLLEHFGKKIENDIVYNTGRRKIIQFLEETYLINKIQSKGLFDLLEKSKVIYFKIEIPEKTTIYNFQDYDGLYDDYVPFAGCWYINS